MTAVAPQEPVIPQRVQATDIEAALVQRLHAVAAALLGADPTPSLGGAATDAGSLLERLVRSVRQDPSPDRVWLILSAVTATIPLSEDVTQAIHVFNLFQADIDLVLWLLDLAHTLPNVRECANELTVVSDRVLVEVDHSARVDLHTGIQQVARRTLPLWVRDHGVIPVAWTDAALALRPLLPDESQRAMGREMPAEWTSMGTTVQRIVIPWRTVVVLPETLYRASFDRLVSLARYSGNSVVVIGHDCIPVISADLVPMDEPNRFARFLTVVKYANRVSAVSRSAAAEFRGFTQALVAQGLQGPVVVHCPLAVELPAPPDGSPDATPAPSTTARSLVLSVGSFEPRKNHLALLYAAERLWREGLDFDLLLIAGSGWFDEITERLDHLREQGRPIEVRTKISNSELSDAYRQARFVVFPSLHEGFGLPVAEAFSVGTPVITGKYGSTAETTEGGGAITIDPQNDEELVEAIRLLLLDDRRLGELEDEIKRRPRRTWEQFGVELWDCLVRPELELLQRGDPR